MPTKKNYSPPPLLYHLTRNTSFGILAILLALFTGMCGYHFLEKLSWEDAFLNASMILSGMGPVAHVETTAGKIFAGCYALFSGLIFIAIIALIFAPLLHRFFRRVHLDSHS